jgi:hypothetical protein
VTWQVGVALVDRFTDSTCLQLHQAAGGPMGGPAGLAVQRMNRVRHHHRMGV